MLAVGVVNTSVFSSESSSEDGRSEEETKIEEIINSSRSSAKKFLCTYDGCTKSFAKLSKLQRHEITHTGEVIIYVPLQL
jgi:uncharacterized Zn-finger protein